MEILFYIYLSCFLVGGTVVFMAAFGGHHVGDGDLAMHADAGSLPEGVQFLSFFSIRRLFFFACFFGLTGLLGTWFSGGITTLVAALLMGGVCAWGGDTILKRFTRTSYSSSVEPEELIGTEAVVTVPISPLGKGKISFTLKGHTMEILAQASDGQETVNSGKRVLILEMQDGVATIDSEAMV